MKKIIIVCVFISIILLSCATAQDKIDEEQKAAIYAEIQNEIDKLDPFECRDFLANYIADATYVTAKYKGERDINWGELVIHSPIRASANLYIKTYRYRFRNLNDPREIYYLLKHMQSFIQFEAIKTIETKSKSNLWLFFL